MSAHPSPIASMSRARMPRATWRLLASLYSTQFLGLMFFIVAMVAILRERGAGLDVISMIYMLGMIWPLKILWAPLIDRFSFGRAGHYRAWLLLTQAGMVAALVAVGGYDVRDDFSVIYALCVVTALLSATQDIALDGLACSLLETSERGLGNGLQIAGGLVGNMVGGGVMLMVYPVIGWRGCTLALAALTAVSVVQLLCYREPVWPGMRRQMSAMYGRFWMFWKAPGSIRWLVVLLLYPVASATAYSVLMPILVDAGWALDRIGLIVNVLGSAAGLFAALATGRVLSRIGRGRAMAGAAVLQLAGVLAITVPALGYTSPVAVTLAVIAYFLFYNPAATVLATLMMDRASTHSPATDYTLQYSLSQCFVMGMTSAGAALAMHIGYLGVLSLSAALAVLAILLVFLLDPTRIRAVALKNER
ncbi:MAG: MFS transporter [Pollutimonas bauzanensis]